MVVIFAYIPMFAWEANIGMLAPGGYIRKIRSLVDCDSSYEPDEIDEIKNQMLLKKMRKLGYKPGEILYMKSGDHPLGNTKHQGPCFLSTVS